MTLADKGVDVGGNVAELDGRVISGCVKGLRGGLAYIPVRWRLVSFSHSFASRRVYLLFFSLLIYSYSHVAYLDYGGAPFIQGFPSAVRLVVARCKLPVARPLKEMKCAPRKLQRNESVPKKEQRKRESE